MGKNISWTGTSSHFTPLQTNLISLADHHNLHNLSFMMYFVLIKHCSLIFVIHSHCTVSSNLWWQLPGMCELSNNNADILLQGKRQMAAVLSQYFHICAREAWQPSSLSLAILMQYPNWSAFIPHPHWIYGDRAHVCHRAARPKEKWPEERCHPPSTLGGSRRRHHTGCLLIKIYTVCLYISINHFWVHVDDHESKTGVDL